MNGVNRGIFRLLPVFLLLFLGVSSCSQKEERRILVIHSYEETYAAYPEFNRMIAEQFEKEKIDADIRTVYLDCESYWEEPELERMRFLVDSVSRDWRPEVILVNEDQATYSLMKWKRSRNHFTGSRNTRCLRKCWRSREEGSRLYSGD